MKKLLLGPFSHALGGSLKPAAPAEPVQASDSIPLEISQAADDVLDIFTMYRLLNADPYNYSYWPERKTLVPDGQNIDRFTIVLTLFHTTLENFAAYKIVSESGRAQEKAKIFHDRAEKFEVMISKPDEVSYRVTMHVGNRPYLPKCTARDDVMFYAMKFVRATSPAALDQIELLERAWGLNEKPDEIAFNF